MSAARFRSITRRAVEKYHELCAQGIPDAAAMEAAIQWEVKEVRAESERVRGELDLMRLVGLRVYAERRGITPRSAQRRRESFNKMRRELVT